MRIGLVDLDTSHPGSWAPIIRDLGYEVSAVWDGGTIYPTGYAAEFAAEHGIPNVCDNLEQMADIVDCAIIHSCNWDLHVQSAHIFIERQKAVLIDKPMVGNARDLRQIVEWAESGARIIGGSSLRFNYEVAAFLARPTSERGEPKIALAGCGVDFFNYGIHAYSTLWSIFGGDAKTVRYLGNNGQAQVEIVWADGRRGIVTMGPTASWLPFYATVVTDALVHQTVVDSTRVYQAFLEKALPYLAGEAEYPPIPMRDLLEPEMAALAARKSENAGGILVDLNDIDDVAYDGAAFAAEYRRQKGFR